MALTLIGNMELVTAKCNEQLYWMGPHDYCLIGTSDLDCVYTGFTEKTMVYTQEKIFEYTAPIQDGATMPSAPLNPGNLDTTEHVISYSHGTTRYVPWWCIDYGFVQPHGNPLQGYYREVWQYNVPFYQLRFKNTANS